MLLKCTRIVLLCMGKQNWWYFPGMTVLAQTYHDDEDRSKAMGFALGGVALGVLGKGLSGVLVSGGVARYLLVYLVRGCLGC